MTLYERAEKEYQRLCQLIGGNPPYGDCQLVSLMIYRAVPDSQIVQGYVEFMDGDRTEHFWVQSDDRDLDLLARDWLRTPINKVAKRIIDANEILEEYRRSAELIPDFNPDSLFPLRWMLRNELLTL
jgi:hypothetical protein